MDNIKKVFSVASFTSKQMSESTKLWSQLMIQNPSIRSRLFTDILISYLIHQNDQVGLFLPHPRKDSNIFTLKMIPGPTQIKESIITVNPSLPYIILIDFIEEHYKFYNKLDQNLLVIISELMIEMLKSTMNFKQFPSSRSAWIRILTFSMDLISSLINRGIIKRHQKILWKYLFLSMIELCTKSLTWNVQNIDILKLEVSLIDKCTRTISFLLQELSKISPFSLGITTDRQFHISQELIDKLSKQSSRVSLQDANGKIVIFIIFITAIIMSFFCH